VGGRSDGTSDGTQAAEVPEPAAEPALDVESRCGRSARERSGGDHVGISEELAHHDRPTRDYHSAKLAQGRDLVRNLP
jgi:hypothetical protein